MQQRKYNDITDGPLVMSYVRYLMPLMLSSFVQLSFNIVDALIIGNFAGSSSLAAVDAPISFVKFLLTVFMAFSGGGSIVIAQRYGAKDYDSVGRASSVLMLFSIIAGIVISIVGVLISPWGIKIINVPDDLVDLSMQYLEIYFAGAVFLFIYNVASGILRAVGDSKRPFIYLAISAVLNVGFDLLAVAYFGWGVRGAAAATVLSQGVAAILCMIRLIRSDECFSIRFSKLAGSLRELKATLQVGIPIALQGTVFSISNIYMQSGINSLGTNYVAGWAITGKSDSIIFMLSDSLSLAITTFVAQNYGAGKLDRAKNIVRIIVIAGLILFIPISLFLYFRTDLIASLFTNDETTIKYAILLIQQVAPIYFIFAIGGIYLGAIRGYGDTIISTLVALPTIGIFRIIWMSFYFPAHRDMHNLVLGYIISWVSYFVLSFSAYHLLTNKKYGVNPSTKEVPETKHD